MTRPPPDTETYTLAEPAAPTRVIRGEPVYRVVPGRGELAVAKAKGERRARRFGRAFAFWCVVGCLCAAYFALAFHYWAPAHAGTDQHGYLMGGKLLATTGKPGFTPANAYAHVGGMFVLADSGEAFPKYPAGLPLLVATCVWIGHALSMGDAGYRWAYLISPVSMTLAVAAVAAIGRRMSSGVAGIAAAFLLGGSPVALALVNNPNSHAPALAFATVGMAALFAWWKRGGAMRAIVAGLCVGFACTIRYTEGLLVLPLAWAVLCRGAETRRWFSSVLPIVAWGLPIGLLLIANRFWLGHWTGYDLTNESSAFEWRTMIDGLASMVGELNRDVAFFIAPLAVFGFVMLLATRLRVGVWLLMWLVPSLAVYGMYFWGHGAAGTAHTRFYLTIVPPVALAVAWAMDRARQGSRAGALAVLAFVAIPVGLNVHDAVSLFERDHTLAANLADATDHVRRAAGTTGRAIVFTRHPGLWTESNQFEFALDVDAYEVDSFVPHGRDWLINSGGDDPKAVNSVDLRRRRQLREHDAHATAESDAADLKTIVDAARLRGGRVLVYGERDTLNNLPPAFRSLGVWTVVDRWTDATTMSDAARKRLPELDSETAWARDKGKPHEHVLLALREPPAATRPTTRPSSQPTSQPATRP